jgi:CheY-like chemotaxis protein
VVGLIAAATAAVSIHAAAGTAFAQADDAEPTPAELLNDFTYYVNIARFDLAEANARALLDSGLTPREFVTLVEEEVGMADRFDSAYRRALRFPAIEDEAADLWNFYEEGQRARARDLERIRANIELLRGPGRQRTLGSQRLVAASQYAVPSLLQAMLEGGDPLIETAVQEVLVRIGGDAVVPLCTALPNLRPADQEIVCYLLGRIQSRTALPWLYELEAETDEQSVREAARANIAIIDGGFDNDVEAAGLYRLLADRVLGEGGSYTPFPGERHQLLWNYDPRLGLLMTPVYTEVYHEAFAMDLAERGLRLDAGDTRAVAVWLEANFKRENEQPDGYDNPAYPETKPDAEYYAVSAGTRPLEIVLEDALINSQTYIATRAIDALERVAGNRTMIEGVGPSGAPLVEALSYADRRVRYDAALAIASSAPTSGFDGSQRVVPLLASILRNAGERFALVVTDDVEQQQFVRSGLEAEGYTVLAPAATLEGAQRTIIDAPGIDLIVTALSGDRSLDLVDEVRASPRLRATPVLALLPFNDLNAAEAQVAGDSLTELIREGITEEQLRSGAEQLVKRNVGDPLTETEATQYSIRSLNALYDLAVSRNEVLDVSASTNALLAALGDTSGPIRARVAEVLSFVDRREAQVALADAALDASGSERIAMMNFTADSAKRFGNRLEPRQVNRIIEAASRGADTEATAAAALLGALDLPSDRIVPLILGD